MLTRRKFTETMLMLCEMYNRTPSEPLLEGYWMVLKQMEEPDFIASVQSILEHRSSPAMPKPAEILEYTKPNTEAIAALALQDLERAIAKGGRNMSLIFDDKVVHSVISAMGGWIYICDMSLKDWEFKKKEFPRLYAIHAKRNEHPDHVAGLTEKNSGLAEGQRPNFARVGAGYVIPKIKPVAALNPVNEKVALLANTKRLKT